MSERFGLLTKLISKYEFALKVIFFIILTTVVLYSFSNRSYKDPFSIESSDIGKQNILGNQKENSRTLINSSVQRPTTKIITYNGISFAYKINLASEVKANTIPQQLLQSTSDKPDSVTPEHISFSFFGYSSGQHESSLFLPEIHIYPIEDYKKALSISMRDVYQFENIIQTLKDILYKQPASWERELPFLPYGIDANQAIRTHIKYTNFDDGKGIFFLTQYNIEPSLINNQGLIYTFQGITNDGKYYVSATFPVTATFLPRDFEIESVDEYRLPTDFYGKAYELNKENYRVYLSNITHTLEETPPDSFSPNLTIFEELIRSLRINN